MTVMRGDESKLKLTVNETKTRLCRLPDESFDFLVTPLVGITTTRTGESYVDHVRRGRKSTASAGDRELTTLRKAGARRRDASGDDQPQN